MNNIAWWYTVVFGLPSLVLVGLIAALAVGLTRANPVRGLLVALAIYFGVVLLFVILAVSVPWPRQARDEPPHGALLTKGNWVTVWEHPTRPDRVVKQWHSVHDRRSTWSKIFKANFSGSHRSLLDYYGWAACMIVQWHNNELSVRNHKKIHGVPATEDLNPRNLSWSQERGFPVGDRPIGAQLAQTNRDLKEHGLTFLDVHAGNIMMNTEGQLLFVDGEMSRGVELALMKQFYRTMGYSFVPVADNDRILWSDEEKGRDPPVTSANHRGRVKPGKFQA